ncbi:hypothetical protein [Leptospira sp. GIMC2001]|uniref:hypothetical protein n=1 Tax=Leptospira sp. GIMC2001 TaxID=1513297 RepID=UPI00234B14CE|nr:hypothetical protein [Leptospira sp. GIMC2001]WCL48027.1 hypothetical protein O4O04_11935 [Leptospira sp. GIMC2001]
MSKKIFNYFNKILPTILFLLVFQLTMSNCNRELAMDHFQVCDLFDNQGKCTEPWDKTKTYQLRIPANKKLKTWEDLSHFLYFQARETPGIVIYWNRDFTESEKKEFKSKNCHGVFVFYGRKIEMEGKEIGDNWMGFFHYLGTILEEEMKHRGRWTKEIYLSEVFPAPMEIGFHCGDKSFMTSTEIDLSIIK